MILRNGRFFKPSASRLALRFRAGPYRGIESETAAERTVMPTTQVNGQAVTAPGGDYSTSAVLEPSWFINREL